MPSHVDEVARQNAVLYALDQATAAEGEATCEDVADYLRCERESAPLPLTPLSRSQLQATLARLRKDGLVGYLPRRLNGPGGKWVLSPDGMTRLDRALRRTLDLPLPVAAVGPRLRPSGIAIQEPACS